MVYLLHFRPTDNHFGDQSKVLRKQLAIGPKTSSQMGCEREKA
jgi:hypothetical protein